MSKWIQSIHHVDRFITTNFVDIKKIVSEDGGKRWTGTPIQSNRYEIQLSFDTSVSMNCWDKICSDLDTGKNNSSTKDISGICQSVKNSLKNVSSVRNSMNTILDFAKQKTMEDTGEEIFDKSEITTPALIICSCEEDQMNHLDMMNEQH